MNEHIERDRSGQTPECARVDELLPLYALRELGPDEMKAVGAHLSACARCQARVADYNTLRQGLRREFEAADPFAPFSLSEIILADQLSDEASEPAVAPIAGARASATTASRRAAARSTVRRRWAAQRDLSAIAAALLLTLAAALIFSSLRGAATLPAGPRIIEYPPLSEASGLAGLAGLTTGPDGNIWFTDLFAAQVGRITPSGAITRFNLPDRGELPEGITTGPDGALWFAEYRGSSSIAAGNVCFDSRIGRMTTSGDVRYFTIPANACPDVITLGPDGALWFTAGVSNQIGRIMPSGAMTIYALPHAGSHPEGITTGPDGALWFAERGANQIGRITTGGAITEYPIAGASGLFSVIAGPDGALWFTETGAIGRITTSGVISRFPLLSAYIAPSSIASGPDGALWFTEYSETKPVSCDGSHIGRITTAGRISEYPVTPNSCPSAIVRGPGGTLWFIEAERNALGEIRPAG